MEEKIKKIYKTAKSIIFSDPELLYKEERHLASQPFYFPGTNGKAVLLIHGWTSVPYEVRRLGKYLNENGYTVSAPMLSGHGTVPKDLENVGWEKWLEDVRREYARLKAGHEKVFVAGTSIGGNLAAILAVKNPEISAVVLMATPYKIKMEKPVVWWARFLSLFKKYNRKFYPPTFGVSTTITRIISYQAYPLSSTFEVQKLIEVSRIYYPKISQPCLVMQSTHDHIVMRGNLEKIYDSLGSAKKQKKYIEKAYHTFVSDIKNGNVFKDVLEFIDDN